MACPEELDLNWIALPFRWDGIHGPVLLLVDVDHDLFGQGPDGNRVAVLFQAGLELFGGSLHQGLFTGDQHQILL
jgi:uncharacterized membrane protein YgdD (TMEM256/DUF423 family)